MLALKADFHLHTSDDRKDYIEHNAYQLIRHAARKGFKILSITNHDTFTFRPDLQRCAEDHGILLIPGIEKTVEKRHVLILNAHPATEQIETFEDLRRAKDDELFYIAPHPFFRTGGCLEQKLYEHIDLFDAVEYSFFYSKWFNLNRQAELLCQDLNLALVGNSDCHLLKYMGICHSIIRAPELSIESVFAAIQTKQVEVASQPIFLPRLAMILFEMIMNRRKAVARRLSSHPVSVPKPERVHVHIE